LAIDLRILFLFLLFLTLILFALRQQQPAITFNDLRMIVLDFLFLPVALGTVLIFAFLITRTDPFPYLRQLAYELSLRQNVAFEAAIPERLDNYLNVHNIQKLDTDGDNFDEWVVSYRYELRENNNPVKVIIYDNDRGDPPVIFPYQLRVPNRDYLAEDSTTLNISLEQVTEEPNGMEDLDLPEILVSDRDQLSIFRFEENSAEWDFPRDAPPRYQAIGFFRGNVGQAFGVRAVAFDELTRNVTVLDRSGFERSQLMVRSVYGLNPATNTYWQSLAPLGSDQPLNPVLAAPIVSTVDFFAGPPDDILQTTYPEKIVLAFYTALCGEVDDTLCINNVEWNPTSFLAMDALQEYNNDNADYFGLPFLGEVPNISVNVLRYYPRLETDADLLVTGPGRDVVTGEEPRFNIVDIGLVVGGSVRAIRYEMGVVDGLWKIVRRVGELDPVALQAPVEINAPQ
jgi:hypothetical protein